MGALVLAQPEDLALRAQRGKELMAAGRFAEAAVVYNELVTALPGNPGLLLNLGMAYQMAGEVRQAIPQFQAALKLQPDLLPASLFLGASHMKAGQPALAVAPLRRVVGAQPAHKEARQMLADALLALERFDQAVDHFVRLSSLDPDNPRAWYGLGHCHEAMAGDAFGKLEKLAPESAYGLVLVAASRARQRQHRGAFYLYRRALAVQPGLRGVHAALAEIYRATGHAEWAALEERSEGSLPPPDCKTRKMECDYLAGRHRQVFTAARLGKTPESYYWLARASNELALAAYSRLAQLPPSVEIHQLMAELHRVQGRHLDSANEWRAALTLAPADPRLEQELAVSLHLSRDHEAVRSLVEKLLRAQPDSAALNFLLGDTLLALQQVEQALPWLEKAVRADSTQLEARAALGRALMQLGRDSQAIPHLKAALDVDQDGSLHFQLGRAYQAAGQAQAARSMLARSQEIRSSALSQRKALEDQAQITPP